MKIFINDKEVEIFAGATVRDALNMFKRDAGIDRPINKADIRDHRGNSLSPAGELSDDDRLYIKERNDEGGNK
jgi:hypothetical protein